MMSKVYLYKIKSENKWIRAIPPVLIIAAVLIAFIYGFSGMPGTASDENLAMTERAVRTALVNCYAIEGFYPQSFSYLEENYGLRVDHDKYFIFYNFVSWNMIPSVRVVPIDGGIYVN